MENDMLKLEKVMTQREFFNSCFYPNGYKNFIPKYCSLLIEPIPARNEQELVEAICKDVDRDSYLLEIAAREVSELISRALGIFNSIVKNSGPQKETSDFYTTQIALHEYMFKTLYHINRSCRLLLEAHISSGKHDNLKAYLQYLKKKYAMPEQSLILIGQKWFKAEKMIHDALVARKCRIKVYDNDRTCFQIYNSNMELIIREPAIGTGTSNGLIISQYYFVWQIIWVFQHLLLCTQSLELEKTGVTSDDNTELKENNIMAAFIQAANELFEEDLEHMNGRYSFSIHNSQTES